MSDPEALKRKTLFVAVREGLVLGSVAVATFFPAFWKSKYWAEPKAAALGVFDLVVFPDLQGQGVGKFLMDGVEELAHDRGFSYVRLDAFAQNPSSNGFYRRIGYVDRGEIEVRTCRLQLYEKCVRPV